MAVAAYWRWVNAGRPLTPARPIREFVERLQIAFPRAAAAHLFSWHANEAHYTAVPAEDHTPFSQTGWPQPSPEWWVLATDVMHRPDLGVDCNVLFGYWIGEARAGRMPWLKYINWQGRQWRARGYGGETVAFRTAWANSGHFEHIHLSGRTDHRDTGLGAWSVTPGGDDMTPEQAQQALIDAWRLDALQSGSDVVRGGPLKGETMWTVVAVKAQAAATAALRAAVAAIGTNSPEVAELMAQVQAALDAQTAALKAATAQTVAEFGEGGAEKVREPGGAV